MKRMRRQVLSVLGILVFLIAAGLSGNNEIFAIGPPVVLTVPADITDANQPHYSYNGHLTTFKAVVPGAGLTADYYYRWDIDGDGNWDQLAGKTYANAAGKWYRAKGSDLSGQQYLPSISEERKLTHSVIEVAAGINPSTGAPVDSGFGTYPLLQYRDLSSATPSGLSDTQRSILKNIAMEDAMWYLHQQFVRVEASGAGATGYIPGASNDVKAANTALYVLAMAENGHYAAYPAGSNLFGTSALNERNDHLYNIDPYADDLYRAVNYLLNNLAELTIYNELDQSDDGVDRIDGGIDYSGLHIPFYTVPEINSNGVVLSALAKSRLTGSTVAAGGSLVNGLPFELIIQRMVDAGIASQIDENNIDTQGGWTYGPANNDQVVAAGSVNSLISGGWIHGLHTAEEEMGADGVYINNRLKDRLANHIEQNQTTDGGCTYSTISIFSPVGDYLLACKWLGWDQWDASDTTPAGYASTSITKGEARQIYDRYLQYVIDHWETPYDSTKNYYGSYLWASGNYDSADAQACLSGAATSNLATRSLYGIRNFAEYETSSIASFGTNDWKRQFSVSLIKGQHALGYYKEAANSSLEQYYLGLPGTTAYGAMAGGDPYPQVLSALSIVTTVLMEATAGSEYGDQIVAAGGLQENYSWTISGLPAGLTYNSASGAISGTPTLEGNYTLQVGVADTIGSAAKTLTLAVRPGILAITADPLPDSIAGEPQTYSLSAVGGSAPYSWRAANLPLGLSMDAVTGEITGIPIESGSFSIDVTLTDSAGKTAQKTLALQLNHYRPLRIDTSELPAAYTESYYSMILKADGGKPMYSWSGTGLPEGLTLWSTGELSGTPASEGTYPISVTAEDGEGKATQANFTLVVRAVNITTADLPPVYWGETAQTYSFTMGVEGGAAPYTWSYTLYEQNSDLPLSMHSGYGFDGAAGRLYGTTQVGNQPTDSDILIRVTDAEGKYDEKRYAWDSYPDFARITTATIPNGYAGQDYTVQLSAANAYGDEHFVWNAESIPAGLSIDETTGVISGRIEVPGEYGIKVTARLLEDSSKWVTKYYRFYIFEPLRIDTTSLPGGSVNTAYRHELEAGGGMLPYPLLDDCVWSAYGLPSGLHINEKTGIVYGMPGEAGTFSVTIGLLDSEDNYTFKSIELVIADANKYSIHSLTFRKPDGALLSSIPVDTDFDVCATLSRNAEADGELLLVALYDGKGRLLSTGANTSFLSGTTLNAPAEFVKRISRISGRQIAKIKVFILSGADTIKPASNVGE